MVQITQIQKILALSGSLTTGIVLIILSCSLYSNWLPLIVVMMFLIAPIPNSLCGNARNDDIMSETPDLIVDFGRFLTAFLVVSGAALPIVLANSNKIGIPAMCMSLVGGVLVYITIVTFQAFASENEEY